MLLKNKILKSFQEQEVSQVMDETLVDELIFNIEVAQKAKISVSTNGTSINITRNPEKQPFLQISRDWRIYNEALKNIIVLCRTLNISKEGKKILLDIANSKPKLDALDAILMNEDE